MKSLAPAAIADIPSPSNLAPNPIIIEATANNAPAAIKTTPAYKRPAAIYGKRINAGINIINAKEIFHADANKASANLVKDSPVNPSIAEEIIANGIAISHNATPNIIKAPAAITTPAEPSHPAAPTAKIPIAINGRADAAAGPYMPICSMLIPMRYMPAPASRAAAPRISTTAANASINGIAGPATVAIMANVVNMVIIATVIAASTATAAKPCSAAAAIPIPISQNPAPTSNTATPSCINGMMTGLTEFPRAARP